MGLMSDNLSSRAATSTAGGKGVMEKLKQLFILHSVDLRSMLLKSRVDVEVAPTSQAGSGAVQIKSNSIIDIKLVLNLY